MNRRACSVLVGGLAGICLLSGCATMQVRGTPSVLEKASRIEIGMTEEAVMALLGKPSRVQQRSSGQRVLFYEVTRISTDPDPWMGRIETTTQTHALHLLIDQGRVLDHTMTESTKDADEIDRTQPRYIPVVIPIY